MSTYDFTVLIEGAGTATAISVLKGLSLQDEFSVRTIVLDNDDLVAGKHFADKLYVTSPSKSDGYIDEVLDICKKESVDVYIPIIDYGFEKLAEARERFAQEGIFLMVASPKSMALVADKYKTFEFFSEHDIPTPRTWVASDTIPEELDFPFIIKPRRDGRASLGVYIIEDEEAFRFHTRDNDNYVMQEIAHGKEFTADCLNSLDGKEYITSFVRERTETKGGVSVKGRMVEESLAAQIQEYLEKITTALEVPGVCNVQGFVSEDGTIFFSEVNPRFAGTHVLSIQSGLNSIYRLLQMKSGKSAADVRGDITINPNVTMVRYWNEIFFDDENTWTWNDLIK